MDSSEDSDAIEEISFTSHMLFGKKNISFYNDLVKGIIVHIRIGHSNGESQNTLISMLECLFSESDVSEKKRLLTEKYGMVMTSELEGRVQTMCNWSEVIIEQGIKQERLHAIERMLKAGATMAQILSYGYTQEEFAEVESGLFANA